MGVKLLHKLRLNFRVLYRFVENLQLIKNVFIMGVIPFASKEHELTKHLGHFFRLRTAHFFDYKPPTQFSFSILNCCKMSLANFETISKLGQGAFSQVYKVRRISDGEIYALK